MGLLALLFAQPSALIALLIPLMDSMILHENAQGAAALLFRDDTAKRSGRLSLNPLRHLVSLGFLMLIPVRFGWARGQCPSMISFFAGNRVGMFCAAIAGAAVNMGIAPDGYGGAAIACSSRRVASIPDLCLDCACQTYARSFITFCRFLP